MDHDVPSSDLLPDDNEYFMGKYIIQNIFQFVLNL